MNHQCYIYKRFRYFLNKTVCKNCIVFITFIAFLNGCLPAQPAWLPLNGKNFQGTDSVSYYLKIGVDTSGKAPARLAQFLPYRAFNGTHYLDKKFTYWYSLPLENVSADTLKALLCFNKFTKTDLFYKKNQLFWEHRKGGSWTNNENKSYGPNLYCHPINLNQFEKRVYYIALSDYFHSGTAKPDFRLLTYEQEKDRRLAETVENSGKQLYDGLFFGILLLFITISLLQFFQYADKAYLYYASYTICLLLFYLRTLDFDPIFGNLKAWHPNLEAPLGYLCIIFYFLFFRSFLNLTRLLPALDLFFYGGAILFAGMLALDVLVIQPVWGWQLSMDVHSYFKLPFLILSFSVAVPGLIKMKSRLALYLLAGTTFLLIPVFFTVFSDLAPGNYQSFWSNTMRKFTPHGWTHSLYMYDMRIGLLLEILCFLLGLGYKTRLDRLRLRSLTEEMEALKNAPQVHITHEPPTLVPENPWITKLRETALAHLHDDTFGTESLAAALGMDRVKLYRKMEALHLEPPSGYLRTLRMESARRLLRTTPLTVSEIAYQVGFRDASHFSKTYRKTYGLNPKNDRNPA